MHPNKREMALRVDFVLACRSVGVDIRAARGRRTALRLHGQSLKSTTFDHCTKALQTATLVQLRESTENGPVTATHGAPGSTIIWLRRR